MNKLLKDYKRDYIFLSIGYIVLGVLLLFMPETSGRIMCYILAAISAFFGITHIIAYMNQKYPYEVYRFDLVYGIVGLAGGAFIFIRPDALINFLPIVLGIIVFIDSIVKVQHAVDLKRMGYESWWIILILALCMSGVGLLMIMYPFSTFMTVVMFSGICLIVNAIVNLYAVFTLTKTVDELSKKTEKIIKETEEEIMKEEKDFFDMKAEDIEKGKDSEQSPFQ